MVNQWREILRANGMRSNKIKFLLFINLARVSDLNVTRTKLPWKQIPPHTIVEITQPPGSFRHGHTKRPYEILPRD